LSDLLTPVPPRCFVKFANSAKHPAGEPAITCYSYRLNRTAVPTRRFYVTISIRYGAMEDVYEPCSCGSGKKYKFCCYQKARERRWVGSVGSLPTITDKVGPIIQLKVTLLGTDPEIWRRILVRSNTTLGRLHHILQTVMGWDHDHPHQFVVNEESYGSRDPEFGDPRVRDEESMPVHVLVMKGIEKFTYEYDFGDGWEHDIAIETDQQADPKLKYPACIEGERACPPEDCGGIHGFYDKLETLKNPGSDYYEDVKEWMGDFDPDKFSLRKGLY
jgi:hypothetical protein